MMPLSKPQPSSYQEYKQFLSSSYTSQEKFVGEYKRIYYRTTKAEELYILILTELDKATSENNIDHFKKLGKLIDYISGIEDQTTLRNYYYNPNNPIERTNLVILACKYDKENILKYLFSNDSKLINNLSIDIGAASILPEDVDETCHNAFYYAIRSGNSELLKILINKWPGNYFVVYLSELDEILSRAYEELKLKNVPLTEEIEIFVENELINLRFFSDDTAKVELAKNDPNNVSYRIGLVLENISLLIAEYMETKEVDEKFLFIATFVAQNIHILKRQLKATYDRLPWEEMEFCLVSFVSSHTKQQEVNLFYKCILNKSKILNHLANFAEKLEEVRCFLGWIDVDTLSDLPKLKREKVVAYIIRNYSQFKELYEDYEPIRDMRSLEKICNYARLTQSVDPKQKEGQLVIIRALQVIGEYMKNTLESPKLSSTTSELFLILSPEKTKQIITNLRNSLSHAYSLNKRREIEESADNFFDNIKNDIAKIYKVANDIFLKKKLKVARKLLEKILCSKDPREIRETVNILDNNQLRYLIRCLYTFGNGAATKEDDKIVELINELKNKVNNKTNNEENLFNLIDNIINPEKFVPWKFNRDYKLESEDFLLKWKSIGNDCVEEIKTWADFILLNIEPNVGTMGLNEVIKFVMHIYKSISSRIKDQEVNNIIRKIVCIAEFDISKIKWIEELKRKLDAATDGYKEKLLDDKFQDQDYQKTLGQKLSTLKGIINKNRLDNQLIEKFSYKKDQTLQPAVEMLVLDIMSILGCQENLEHNLLFLDDNTPLLTGKCLRNHLAHNNDLVDILLSDPSMAVILNAKILAIENATDNKKIGKLVRDNPFKIIERFNQGLVTIDIKEEMFMASEEGNLEGLKRCLNIGGDINARSVLNLWTALHFAAKGSNLEIVQFLLDNNLNIDVEDVDNQYPLHVAASFGSYDIVKYFLEDKGMNVNCSDNQKRTLLHMAAQNGHKNVVELLLKSNADISVKDCNGLTPLHYAIINDHRSITSILLKKEANVDINRTKYDFTPLHTAAKSNRLELVKLLITKKANVNAKGYNNWTPLHCVAKSGNKEIAEILIKNGANINAKSSLQGDTPLHIAAEFGNIEIIEVLLNSGADINVKSVQNNDTPLHLAAERGHNNIVNILLGKGADANSKDGDSYTPLHLAGLRSDNKEVVEALIQEGADANIKCKGGDTPLHFAVRGGYEGVVGVLLKEGADINIKNDDKITPTVLAVFCGHFQIVKRLLQHKEANVNAKGNNDCTILHFAVNRGDVEVTKYLVDNGADVNARCSANSTPLHYAAENGNGEIVKILIKSGASICAKNDSHFEPLHIAAGLGHREVVEILLEENANVNAEGDEKFTPLHLATQYGKLDVVKILLDKGARVNAKSNQGTPLCQVYFSASKEIVELLIENGADIAAANNDGFTALHAAAAADNNNALEVLLQDGANVNVKSNKDSTPIELAALYGNIQAVKTLLQDKRININAKDNNNCTILHVAVQSGNVEVVKYLLENGADFNAQSIHGNTPLHLAVANGNKEIIEILIAKGVDISLKNNGNRTADELELALTYDKLNDSEIPKVGTTPSIPEQAKKFFELHLGIRERYYGSDHPKYAETLTNLGEACLDLDNNCEAEQYLQHALKIQESHCGSESPELVRILTKLGVAYEKSGDLGKHMELLKRISKIQERHDSESSELAGSLVNLGLAYDKLGDPEKYRELLERALKIQEGCNGPHHCEVVKILIYLSLAYGKLGNHLKKKDLLERALPIQEKHYGPDDLKMVDILVNLGNAHGALGDVQKQKLFLERALEIQKRFDSDEFRLAITLNNLGGVYLILHDVYRAKELMEQALTIKEKHGTDHYELASTLSNLSMAYGQLGDFQKKKKLLERCLQIQERHYGPNSFRLSTTLTNLAQVYENLGDDLNTKKLLERVLFISKKQYGSYHPNVLDILGKIEMINIRLKLGGSKTQVPPHVQKTLNSAALSDIKTVRRLLKDGADANRKDSAGRTPLHYAVSDGQIKVVKILLKNGADVTQVTNKGNTPLHTATSNSHKEIVDVLLQHVSDDKLNDFINAKTTSSGSTSLHIAARNGFFEIVKSLLKHGASYNTENKEGKIALDLSIHEDTTDFLKLVKELFEDANSGNVEIISKLKAMKHDEFLAVMNACNNQGMTIVQVAKVNKHKNIARKMLKMYNTPS